MLIKFHFLVIQLFLSFLFSKEMINTKLIIPSLEKTEKLHISLNKHEFNAKNIKITFQKDQIILQVKNNVAKEFLKVNDKIKICFPDQIAYYRVVEIKNWEEKEEQWIVKAQMSGYLEKKEKNTKFMTNFVFFDV